MRVARTLSVTLLLALLGTSAAVGQDEEPLPTEPPALFTRAKIATSVNGFDDPELNEIVDAAVRAAAEEVDARDPRLMTVTPARTVSRAANDWAEDGFDAVLVSGGHQPDTVLFAGQHTDMRTFFVDIAQPEPCVTGDGRPDPSGTCAGGTSALPPNYIALSFAEDEAGYLAGIVAASAARNGRIGIIGGTPDCPICNRYIQGFELGARSVSPSIRIDKAFIADDDPAVGFTDGATARLFTQTFIDVYQPDVLFPVARANTLAMHRAACDLGVRIIGSDLDLRQTHPELTDCVLTSAVKTIEEAVREAIFDISSERTQPVKVFDLANEGVGITNEWQQLPGLPVDLPTRLEEAIAEIRAGLIETCPEHCGRRDPAPAAEPEPSVDPRAADPADG